MIPVENCVSFIVGKAAQQISKRARERLAPFGITPVQYAVLSVLWETPKRTAAELCTRLAIDSATITGIIDRLEAAGLIERRPDPQDRRVYRIAITSAGAKLKSPLTRQMDELNAEVMSTLGVSGKSVISGLRRIGTPVGVRSSGYE